MEFFRASRRDDDAALVETPSAQVLGRDVSAFNFDLARRNAMLAASLNGQLPTPRKTGTTICGVLYKDGVVLGADSRASGGETVVEKDCIKIHYIAPNIYCCGAGTAADTEATTAALASQLKLLRMQTHRPSRTIAAVTRLKQKLFRYQGYISAALVLGGVDSTGAHLYTIYPHGSTDKLPYVTMGSGSLAAMAVFEDSFKENMTEDEAKELVARAVRAGIYNDCGSGNNVYMTVIRGDGKSEHFWPYETRNNVSEYHATYERPSTRQVAKGSTKVLRETFERCVTVEEIDSNAAAAPGAEGGAAAGGGAPRMQLD